MKRALLVPLLCLLLLGICEASKKTSVQKVRYSSYKTHTRIVVDLNGPAEYSKNRLTNPDRLFFDIKDCMLSKKVKRSFTINDKILKKVRLAQFNPSTVRVVLDLNKLKKYSSFRLEEPHRLVIDVYPEAAPVAAKKKTPVKRVLPEVVKKKIKTIVIDAGHGGKDPGAVGPRGLKEKDITLSVGLKLGKILSRQKDLKVVYTRKKDVFVPLNDRTEIANSKSADLFISIHTNASEQGKARGIETYFLNWTNDRDAMRVAARENKVSIKKMQKIQGGLQMILDSLERKTKNEESMRLAHSVQNSIVTTLKKDYKQINDLGVKYALFYVLVGAEMPSVLVEISFISNKVEEKRLSQKNYRNKLAQAIAKGISSYISQSTLIVENVRSKKSEG